MSDEMTLGELDALMRKHEMRLACKGSEFVATGRSVSGVSDSKHAWSLSEAVTALIAIVGEGRS